MKLRIGKKILACLSSVALMASIGTSLLPAAADTAEIPGPGLGQQDILTSSTKIKNVPLAGASEAWTPFTYTGGVLNSDGSDPSASDGIMLFETAGLDAEDTYVYSAKIHQTKMLADSIGLFVIFRFTDSSNYMTINFRESGALLIGKINGVETHTASYLDYKLPKGAAEIDLTIVSSPETVTVYINGQAAFKNQPVGKGADGNVLGADVGFIKQYSSFTADGLTLYNTADRTIALDENVPPLPSADANLVKADSALGDPWNGTTAFTYQNGVIQSKATLTEPYTFKALGLTKDDSYIYSLDLEYTANDESSLWHRPEIIIRSDMGTDPNNQVKRTLSVGLMGVGASLFLDGEQLGAETKAFVRGGTGKVHLDIVSEPTKVTVYINGEKALENANVPNYGPWAGVLATYSDMTVSNIQLYKMPTYTITASAGENGSISPDGAQNVDFRGSATYTITPDEYYLVEDVKVDGVSVGAVKTYTFENVRADHTIAATFRSESLPLTITASAGEHGGIAPNGETTLHKGQSQTYTITPDEGYEIADVLVDGESVGAVETYAFENVEADHTIAASFQLIPSEYTITATPGQHGKIDPAGEVKVDRLGSQTFTITPDEGFKIADVLVDGESVGAVTTYTFENVKADHTIAASFERTGGEAALPEGAANLVTPETETAGGTYKNGVASVKDDNELIFSGISGLTADDTYVYSTRIHLDSIGEQGWNGPRLYFRWTDEKNYLTVIFTPNQVSIYGPIDGKDFGDWGVYRSTAYGCKVGEDIDVTIVSEPEAVTVYVNGQKLIDKAPVKKLDPYIGILSSGAGTAFSTTHTAVYKTAGLDMESTITASAGQGGRISSEGATPVFFDTAMTYTMQPNGGYKVKDVLVDGVSVGAVETYTFENVTADHTISVTFEKDEQSVPDGTPIKVTDLKGEDAGNYFFEDNGFRIPMQLWQHQYWMVTEPETLPYSFYFKARVSYQMVDEEENYHGIRILLRTKDLENSFQVVWFLDGTFYPVALEKNEYVDYDDLGMTKVGAITEESSYLLEISCVGDEYTIYVDGKQALKFTIPEKFRDYRNDIGFQQSFVAFSVEDIELVYGPRPANADPVIPPKDDDSSDPDKKPDDGSSIPDTGAAFPLAALTLSGAALATAGATAGRRKRNRGRDTK